MFIERIESEMLNLRIFSAVINYVSTLIKLIVFLQDEKNQLLITNLWLKLVSICHIFQFKNVIKSNEWQNKSHLVKIFWWKKFLNVEITIKSKSGVKKLWRAKKTRTNIF